MGDPDADFDTLLPEQGDLMEKIEHAERLGDSTAGSSRRWTRCAAPPGDEPVTHLSGGERRRVALCKLLLEQPDLLLLDEPTNHLDAESVDWLEQHLSKYPGAVLAVTHDRYFLDNVAEWILEIDRGRTHPYEGNYSTYLEKKADRLCGAGQEGRRSWRSGCKEELELGPPERQGPPGQVARPVCSATRRWPPRRRSTRKLDFEEIQIPAWPAPGLVSSSTSATSTRVSTADMLVKDLSRSRCPRGGIVGVIGPNGVGKTTLFKTIVGLESSDSGEVKVGETVQDQLRGPGSRRLGPHQEPVAGRVRRPGLHPGRSDRDAVTRLCVSVRLQGPRPAEDVRCAVRW